MTYDEAVALIEEHTDYGGSLDKHALAIAVSTEAAAGQKLTDEHIEDVLAEHGVDFYTNGKVDGQASDLFAGVRALLRASSATASNKEGA